MMEGNCMHRLQCISTTSRWIHGSPEDCIVDIFCRLEIQRTTCVRTYAPSSSSSVRSTQPARCSASS